jgi:hypothetical protein
VDDSTEEIVLIDDDRVKGTSSKYEVNADSADDCESVLIDDGRVNGTSSISSEVNADSADDCESVLSRSCKLKGKYGSLCTVLRWSDSSLVSDNDADTTERVGLSVSVSSIDSIGMPTSTSVSVEVDTEVDADTSRVADSADIVLC